MKLNRTAARLKRKQRIMKKIRGSQERPRLVVFRSSKHIYAQLVDDVSGMTRAASSSLALKDTQGLTRETAQKVGRDIAEKSKQLGITEAVFDRNGYVYHGRVKALADGARESGLKF
jgi:large subunit ribosomal protein L18